MGTPFEESKILIIDDQQPNVLLLEKILKASGYKQILTTTDSRNAIELYRSFQPDLLLLDLNMPYMDGFEIMKQLKETSEVDSYQSILVLTAYTDLEIRLRALEAGARDFLSKPFDRLEVLTRIRNLLEVRLLHNRLREHNKTLEERVKLRTIEVIQTQFEIINRLALAAEFRDNETGNHIIRMSTYAFMLARAIGLNDEESGLIMHASSMHDIGKIGIPDSILLKPGKLTPEEWEIMKTHTMIGARILSKSNSNLLQMAEEIALTHHEKWDGTGYPNGLKGEEIPLNGRISAICDVFDALTSDRPYKKAWSIDEAINEIKQQSGKHFDSDLVKIFIQILPEILKVRENYMDW